jgi:hypothetical protein
MWPERYLADNWGDKLKKKRMTAYQRNAASANIIPLIDGPNSSWKQHFAHADMVTTDLVHGSLISTLRQNVCKNSSLIANGFVAGDRGGA